MRGGKIRGLPDSCSWHAPLKSLASIYVAAQHYPDLRLHGTHAPGAALPSAEAVTTVGTSRNPFRMKTMFQSFDDPAQPELAADRVRQLRELFDQLEIDAFLVPHADEHQGEYLPPH